MEHMNEMRRDVELVIPMIPEMELTATKTAEAVGEFMGLDTDSIDEIKLAIIEACINAMEHSGSEDRKVSVDFEIGEEALTIQISDRGQGFDLSLARDQLEQRREAGTRTRGWGLQIMEGLMDEVRVESGENGTVITMVKRR
jgi:serine/threonine-protein kinase RsbW